MTLSSHCRFYALACLCLIFASLGAVGPASAIPGICIDRTPAPPNAALNDGTDSVVFHFNVDHLTTCTSYLTEIIDPNGLIVFSQVLPCLPKPTGFTWPVPLGAQAGCYCGRVTFFSDWCAGFPNKFEDQATTCFLVKPCAPVTVCKWEDLNGDGIRQPGEPFLPGWTFQFERPLGTIVRTLVTGPNGCATDCIPVEPTGTTTYFIREIVQTGWVETFPATNPFQVSLSPGVPATFEFGNWRPVTISGFKYLDQAPWPWTSPHYVGPSGQQNPPEFEPVPACPIPDPLNCFNPNQLQPDPTPIQGVVIDLWNAAHTQLLATTMTDATGKFSFGPINFQNQFIIEEEDLLPDPPACDTQPAQGGLPPWPGEFVHTVAQSVWPSFCLGVPCPDQDFSVPTRLCITLPSPTVVGQEYGCNYFFNWHPGRLWGLICPDTLALQQQPNSPLPSSTIVVEKIVQATANPWPAGNPSWDAVTGFYQVDPITPQEPEGLRQGTYRLTPPQPIDPDAKWTVTLFCNSSCQTAGQTFELPASGFIDVVVPPGCDVRVDLCLQIRRNETRCFLPVTFTQQGWHNYCDVNGTDIPGGMIYTKFPKAFANFTFFGTPYTDKLLVGKTKTITFEGTTGGLNRLCIFLPQTGPCGKLDTSYLNPWAPTPAGALAGEAVALQMNIAYNDKRLMPRTPGYDLELFTIAKGLFRGKTVGEVMVIADRVLSGEPPCSFGLVDCAELVSILQQINANYEFVDLKTFNDRGYLVPNVPFGASGPPHNPHTP